MGVLLTISSMSSSTMSPSVFSLLLVLLSVVHSGYSGEPPNCECFDDNIAYMGNNIVRGVNNIQPSRDACQKSCQDNPECDFWTWGKSGSTKGRCYLKDARENITPNDEYMSGSKRCKIPDNPGSDGGYNIGYPLEKRSGRKKWIKEEEFIHKGRICWWEQTADGLKANKRCKKCKDCRKD